MRSSQTRHFFGLAAGSIAGAASASRRGKRFDEKIQQSSLRRCIGILIGIILADIEAQQILMLHKLDEGSAHVVKRIRPLPGTFTAGEIILLHDIDIQVENEFTRVGVHCASGLVRRFACALGLMSPA